MKSTDKLGSTTTPDGSEVALYQHDKDFYIKVNGEELMSSRRIESELELGRLGCAHLKEKNSAKVLIGGMGMGYTARAVLDVLLDDATVVVAELLPEVVRWNREIIGHVSDHPLNDKRVKVRVRDVFDLIKEGRSEFDAILLDVDNGPDQITDAKNDQLYTISGIAAIFRALKKDGRMGIWSAGRSLDFEKQLIKIGLDVEGFEVPAYNGPKAQTHYIWIVKAP